MRLMGAAALCLLVVMGLCTATASAAPLSLTFTESRANVGVQLSDAALFEVPDIAAFGAEFDPASGSITAGHLQVPEFSTHITAPIDADVAVDFDIGIFTGSFTAASGALTLQGEWGGTLTSGESGDKECTVSTTPAVLTLSTSGNSGGTSPRSGEPFVHGLTGAGEIAGQWTDMQATPVDPGPGGDTFFCEDVEDRIGGPGGIWLKQKGDVVPPPAPQLTSTSPASPSPTGTPRILGAAEPGATVRVYAGADCMGAPVVTGSAAELTSPGLAVEVAEGSTVPFSATATDAAGNTSACSSSISYTRLHFDPPPPPRACIVPKVKGKSLRGARIALRAAYCGVGEVHKRKPKKGKGRGPLVVRASTPPAGQVLPAGSKVDLKLGPISRKARS